MKKRFLRGKASFMITVLICALFSIYLMAPVSAAEKRCCEKTNTGEYCLYTDASKCDVNVRVDNAAVSCDQISYCQLGCCQTQDEGTCYKNTPLARCNAMDGKFTPDANCDNSDCKKGCCVISGSCSYVNDKKCDYLLKDFPDMVKDFRDAASEKECSDICRSGDEGCCQKVDATCSFTTRGICSAEAGTFNFNKFCSDISLCACTKHYTKGCYEDDVYWFDSCGNREEKVQDCDYAGGTMCGQNANGDFVCKSVNCETTYTDERNVHDPNMGSLRKNGESWCVYESGVGDYLDRPGTRHFKHMCVNGEEMIEPCRDFREEVCIQGKMKDYAEAQCLKNEIYESPVTSNISTVSLGFRFWEDKGSCESADMTCQVVYVKSSKFSSWKCEQNCHCETPQYIDDVNKLCKSMGDCGANLNILGVKSESGFTVAGSSRKAPRKISQAAWADYAKYGVFGGLKLLAEDFEKMMEAVDKDFKNPIQDYAMYAGIVAVIGIVAINAGLLGATVSVTAAAAAASAGTLTAGAVAGSGAGAAVSGLTGVGTITSASGTAIPTSAVTLAPLGVFAIVLVVVVIIAVILYFIFSAETKTYYVTTQCRPWQAPDGGKDCDKCRNEEKFKETGFDDCTEYKCKSLGKRCEFILENEGSSRVSCFAKEPYDVNSPVITPWPEVLTSGYTLSGLEYGYTISPKIKPFTLISFGIKTDELAQCKISEEHTNTFDEMNNYFGDGYFAKEHNITLNLVGGMDYEYYVRCKDPSGNANTREYTIKLSTENLPDLTPPIIEGFNPPDGSYIAANLTMATVNIMLNEPAQCKWSDQDVDYDSMGNTASCDLSYHNTTFITHYDCYATPNVSKGTNNYYFRCMDLKENKNQESTPYSLIVSNELVIVYSAPSGTLYDTNSPTLEVTTAGGSEDGVAACAFSTSGIEFERMIGFFNTNAANHKQPLMSLAMGDHVYYVKCRDSAGNEASVAINFRIDVDVVAPELVYIYSDGSTLHLILDEPSICEYSSSSFAYGTGTKMGGEGTTELMAPADATHYYIKCVDKFNNAMGEIIVYL
ncbi:MAG: hypothetical protein ABIH63_00820 [archaeon]